MNFTRCIVAVAALSAPSLIPAPAFAQEPPPQTQAQQSNPQQTRPVFDDPANTDQEPLKVRAKRIFERVFNPPQGPFVRVGGLPQGAGAALGPAYRRPFGDVIFTTSAVASIRGYWELEAKGALPHLANDRAFAAFGVRRLHLPQEDFFGLGPESIVDTRTSYTLNEAIVFVDGGVKPVPRLTIGATAEYRTPRVQSGKDRRYRSIEELFSNLSAPGLSSQPDFVRVGTRAVFDSTDTVATSAIGGRYFVALDRYSDRSFGLYSFNQWTVDVREFVPVAAGHVIALRGVATGVAPSNGHEVPFFYQPALGGPNGLRGYPSFRFRDRNALLLQGEYRFDLHKNVLAAVFYDTGDVAHSPRGLRLSEFRQDFGAGVRFRSASHVVVRIDIAHAIGEGVMVMFKFSDVF